MYDFLCQIQTVGLRTQILCEQAEFTKESDGLFIIRFKIVNSRYSILSYFKQKYFSKYISQMNNRFRMSLNSFCCQLAKHSLMIYRFIMKIYSNLTK